MNAREIQALRRKFIAIAMLSIFIVMAFIGGAVNLFTHSISSNAIFRTLYELIDDPDAFSYGADFSSDGPSFSDVFSPQYRRNHYFVFGCGSAETRLLYTNSQDENEISMLTGFASEMYADGTSGRGRYGSYYFVVRREGSDSCRIAILEASVIIATELRTMYATLGICFFGLVFTFFLVRHFSKQAIQPEIENSLRQKEFITNASHELKTPLTVIRANTEMVELLNGESEWTKSTISQVDHLTGLINNLVTIAKAQEKEDRSEMAVIDAAKAVNESLDPYELLARQDDKKIVREIAEDVQIKADESKIRQLATILIDNAIKYCDNGGTISVSLAKIKNNKGLRLIMSNTYADGADIDCSRFFDRFYREDSSHNIDRGGYGIGLSIAESICRQYGGDIRAEWKDGVISFICTLMS